MEKEYDNQYFAVEHSDNSSGDKRSDRYIAATDWYLLINTEMRPSVAANASRSSWNIVRLSVEICGGA